MGNVYTANICFDCEKAVCGCSWSKDFTPVPGWTATPVRRKVWAKIDGRNEEHYLDTYAITACPLFERSEPRKTVDYEWYKTMVRERRENRK